MTDDRGGRTTIGDEIFEQVEKLVEGQGMRRTDAFKKISADTGRREGTVCLLYTSSSASPPWGWWSSPASR